MADLPTSRGLPSQDTTEQTCWPEKEFEPVDLARVAKDCVVTLIGFRFVPSEQYLL